LTKSEDEAKFPLLRRLIHVRIDFALYPASKRSNPTVESMVVIGAEYVNIVNDILVQP
jgi:hypothetical protein